MNPVATDRLIRFGVYDANLAGHVLRKGGTRIRLQPKPFRVLAVLLERAGNTVTRGELKELLWAPDTFVDFDHGLNATINKIRETLGDSAEDQRFIETLPNGYRLICKVEVAFHVKRSPHRGPCHNQRSHRPPTRRQKYREVANGDCTMES